MIKKLINPGDVLVWKWDGNFDHGAGDIFGAAAAAFGEMSHTAIVYDITSDNVARVIEASAEGIGYHLIDINKPDISILKPKVAINREKIQFCIRQHYMKLLKENNINYGYNQLLLSILHRFFDSIWIDALTALDKVIFHKDTKVCSELVAEILNLYYKGDPEFTQTDNVTPSNIYHDDRFYIYKKFDETI